MSNEDAHDHEPASADFPKRFGEASWWPFLTAVSLAGVYAAVLVAIGSGALTPLSLGVGVLSLALFAVGTGGWVYHTWVKQYRTTTGNASILRAGMVLFIASDAVNFAAVFLYYFFIRVGTWPPSHFPTGLMSGVFAANTVVLLVSAATYWYAEHSITNRNRGRFLASLAATGVLALAYVAGQADEYAAFIHEQGFSIGSGIFGSVFYALTGLHVLHVVFGIVLLAVVFVRGARGQFSQDRHTGVTTVGWYWYFLVGVWVVTAVILYYGSTL